MFRWYASSAKVPSGCWMNSPLHLSAVPRSAPTLAKTSMRPSWLKSAARQSCLSRMELKKLTSAALNVPSWLLSHRLAGCQWWETNRSGQPSPVKSATAALNDQSCLPPMPAAAAWSVIVTGTGVLGGGVFGGGLGVGPMPGAADRGGTGAGARVGSDTGPLGQFACSMSGSGPSRPTAVIIDPAGSVATPMISVSECPLAETTVAHCV